MDSRIKVLCKKSNYKKILEIVKTKHIRRGFFPISRQLNDGDLLEIQRFVETKIIFHLGANENVPSDLINIGNYFGNKFMDKMRIYTINNIVLKRVREYEQFVLTKLTTLKNLPIIFSHLDRTIYEFNTRFYTLPAKWKLILDLYCRFIVIIKIKLANYFIENSVDETEFTFGFMEVINFEKKAIPFLDNKECCQTGNHKSKCIHYHMLSTIFLPKILLYFNSAFKPFQDIQYDQNSHNLFILEIFILFFKKVQIVLEQIIYLDDITVMRGFFKSINFYLIELIKNVYIENDIEKIVIVLNTIHYINQTSVDLQNCFLNKYGVVFDMAIFQYTNKLKIHQLNELQHIIEKSFFVFSESGNNGITFQRWFHQNIQFNFEINEEILSMFLNILMDIIFHQITNIKYDYSTCILILTDISDIEQFLQKRYKIPIPYTNKIKNFIKIVMYPSDNPALFVNNFKIISKDEFAFSQVLKAFKNTEYNNMLFLQYKKSLNKKL